MQQFMYDSQGFPPCTPRRSKKLIGAGHVGTGGDPHGRVGGKRLDPLFCLWGGSPNGAAYALLNAPSQFEQLNATLRFEGECIYFVNALIVNFIHIKPGNVLTFMGALCYKVFNTRL